MRLYLFCLVAISAAISAFAQVAPTRDLGLVGDRFKPLKYEELTAEQKAMADNLLSGERRGLGGPYNVLLRSPKLGDAAQKFGAIGRFNDGLSKQVNETVIILAARYWTSQFEWTAHKNAALQAGLNPVIANAIAAGKRPGNMPADIEAAYNFIQELLTTHQVSDARFQAAKEKFGEKGIVDMLSTCGWYSMVPMALNVDRYPLARGAQPELKPLAEPIPIANPLGFATVPVPGTVSRKESMAGKSKIELRGDRFPALSYDEMTPDQKATTERAVAMRGTVGIFNIAVRNPKMTDVLWPLGEEIRFHLSVPDKLKELAILLTARYWTAQFEWQAHRGAGIQAGLSEATVRAIAEGKRPTSLTPEEEVVYNFVTELYKTKQVSDATFAAIKDKLGERGIVDIIGAAGYYQIVSMFMNADRYPLANASQQPELKPLAQPLP